MTIAKIRSTFQHLLYDYCVAVCSCLNAEQVNKGHNKDCAAHKSRPSIKSAQKAIKALYELELTS